MLGLPKKGTLQEEIYFNEDGSLKPGSKSYYYYKNLLEKVANDNYIKGVNFVLDDMTKRLDPITKFDLETFDKFEDLPEYASELNLQLKILRECIAAVKTQINNRTRSRSNFREGSRKLILLIEKMKHVPRGTLLNTLIAKDEHKIPPRTKHGGRQKKEVVKEILDPSDILLNDSIEVEEFDDLEDNI